jgi:hypothetical protein
MKLCFEILDGLDYYYGKISKNTLDNWTAHSHPTVVDGKYFELGEGRIKIEIVADEKLKDRILYLSKPAKDILYPDPEQHCVDLQDDVVVQKDTKRKDNPVSEC